MQPRVQSSAVLVAGRIFEVVREVVELPSGLRQDLTIVRHPGAVGVVALQADARVTLVRQYRHAVGRELLEIPAGRLEAGEDPRRAALRELEEETGYRARCLESLGSFFPAPGFCSEELHLFLARDLAWAGPERAAHDADEELATEFLPLPEALERCSMDAKSWIGISRAIARLSARS
ncbi:MAG: NUDIX hydrolase [Planctomycetes bacterium]|nr:NUDIX hydrolase [Planctomycetota bacterium]